MVFHEITRDAIRAAAQDTRDLDLRLVDAQETRRILDRLYGYEVSPVLWRKVMQGLSAGRVQSVATRLVVERERERIAFRSRRLLGPRGDARTAEAPPFDARLVARRRRPGRDRPRLRQPDGQRGRRVAGVALDEAAAPRRWPTALAARDVRRAHRSRRSPTRRSPAAPFMTSTLQQEASRKLRMTAQTAMRVAQRLYENGYITYMRTDSTTLSESAIDAARAQAARDLRRGERPRRAAPVRAQGQERAGGARGDPPVRRRVPHARRGRARAQPRRARALRPDLEAHRRLADGRRPRLRR